MFRKYFPSKEIVFDDKEDYSKPYNLEEDENFNQFK